MKSQFIRFLIALLFLNLIIVPRASAQSPAPQDPRAAGLTDPIDIPEEDIIIHKAPAVAEPYLVMLTDPILTTDLDRTYQSQNTFLALAEETLDRPLDVLGRQTMGQNSITLNLLKSEAKQLLLLPGVQGIVPPWILEGAETEETNVASLQNTDEITREAPLPVTHTVSQSLANLGDVLIYTITIPVNHTGADLEYAITNVLPAGITYYPLSLRITGSEILPVYDSLTNTITWADTIPNFEFRYAMSNNTTHPDTCKMPLFDGGYVDILARYGTQPNSSVYGDTFAFELGILGIGTEYFGEVISYKPYFTDDGYVLMNETNVYVHPTVYQTNTSLPNINKPNGLLSLWWRDMLIDYDKDLNKGVTTKYFTDAFLVEFDDIEDFWLGYTMDFEVFTFQTPDPDFGWPDIIFAYDNISTGWNADGTIGIENADGSIGYTYAYDSGVPQSGDMVCFDYYEVGRDPVVITFAATVNDVLVSPENIPGTTITNTVDYTVDTVIQTPLTASFMVNDTPVAYPQTLTTDEDTSFQIFLTGTDSYPGGTLDYDITLNPPHGSLSGSVSSPVYTPDPNYFGTDWFYYTVSDGAATSLEALILIEVTPVNDAPYFILPVPNQTINEGGSFNKINLGFYINDPETNDDGLIFSFTGKIDLNVEIDAEHFATITTPHEDWFGSETITFKATDPEGAYGEQAVTFTVNNINDAPIAVDDDLGTTINIPLPINDTTLLGNDIDVDNVLSELLVTDISNLLGGTVARADGVITFTPITNYIGLAGFDYTISDGFLTDVGRVNIMITDVNNTAPTTVADTYDMNEYGLLSVDAPGILANDTDPQNNVLRTVLVSPTTNGDLTLNIDGSFTYEPPPAYIGTDSFVYHVTDGILDGADVTVTINVNELPTLQQIIPLVAGWNLVSFNLMPLDESISSVLASITGSYSFVYAWDAQAVEWLSYDPVFYFLSRLQNLDRSMGFWINMTGPANLVVSGKPVERAEIPLSPGWNLVGYPSIEPLALPGALSEHGVTPFNSVWAYDPNLTNPWKDFDPLVPFFINSLQTMNPGWGYWINVSEASTWNVIYDLP